MTRGPAGGPARVVGVYAMAPQGRDDLHRLVAEVLALPDVDGLEMPLGWLLDVGADRLVRDLPDGGRHVLTIVGAEVEAAGADAAFGLASTDPRGRRRALDLVRAARDEVGLLAERGIGVVAVEVHSWPSVGPAGAADGRDALAESLREISGWAWSGARVVVEHCDAWRDDAPGAKRLLPLEAEAAAVESVNAGRPTTPVGMAVNWGRSAIEGRDPALPARHVADLQRRGVLAGVVLSGAAAQDGAFGPAWSDAHPPMREDQPESLLDRAAVAATLAAGRPTDFLGVKVAVRPLDAPVSRRVGLVRTVLDAARPGADRRG